MYLHYLSKTSSFWSVKEYFGVVDRQPFFLHQSSLIQILLLWKEVHFIEHLRIIIIISFWFVFPEIIQVWTHLKGERELNLHWQALLFAFFPGIGSGYWEWSLSLLFSIVKQRPVRLNCKGNMRRVGNFAFRECMSVCSTHMFMCMTREKQTPPVLWGYPSLYWLLSSWQR